MKKQYFLPQCEVITFTPGKVFLISGDANIEKADPTVYDDDFWSIGG